MESPLDPGSIHDWVELAAYFLRCARRGDPGSRASVYRCHLILLERIMRLSDSEAERLEPILTALERRIQALDPEFFPMESEVM